MKNSFSRRLSIALALSGLFTAPVHLLGFAEIARGSLDLLTTAMVDYDSNIVGRAGGPKDTIYTLEPTLLYFRDAGLGKIEGRFSVAINHFADHSQFNSNDLAGWLRISLPVPAGAPETGFFGANYDDHYVIDRFLNQRIRDRALRTTVEGTWKAGPRLVWHSTLRYEDTNQI